MRKCIVSGEMKPKNQLIRVVRSPEGDIFIDPSGKKNGRGAYLTNDEESFSSAKKKDALSRHLKVQVTPEDYDRLGEERVRVANR
ncbi:RNase P modulator RnpM [Alteribacillus sp. HJP-4]|uniref:RNase P modulator RnpM n=1 Tax=Alteribacillus sp. HJP-4 TaxID=2775394 RepID=UPI0035CCF567